MLTFGHFFYVSLIGLFVGLSELINRYKSFDNIFMNIYSWIYMLINVGASILVFYIIITYNINIGSITIKPVGKILFAGLGAMAFLRSSFFTYKDTNDKVIEIGPAAILTIFLRATERQFDQTLSKGNLDKLNKVMIGLNFISASKDLPLIILSLLRVLDDNEQKQLSDEILKLINDTSTTTDAKNIALGALLIKYTGFDLLKSAVNNLKEIYQITTKPLLDNLDLAQQKLKDI